MDWGAWKAAVHGVAEGRARLSDFTFTFHSHALEKEMATHSSVLAWRIPGTGEPGGLLSMGSYRVGHNWSDLAAAAAAALWDPQFTNITSLCFSLLFISPVTASQLHYLCWASLMIWGFPRWLRGKESTCQCRRHGFYPCVGKMPWRRKWKHTPVFLPG